MDVQTRFTTNGRHTGVGMLMHDCTEICLRTHQECMETFQYCLQHGGEHADPHHLKLMQTSIEITYTAARFMMLQSPYHQIMCEVCAKTCLDCAKSCEEMRDDTLMRCAQLLHECSESCVAMVSGKTVSAQA